MLEDVLILSSLQNRIRAYLKKNFVVESTKYQSEKESQKMQIQVQESMGVYDVNITGIVKTIEDSVNFKDTINSILGKNRNAVINLHIIDSYIITSSIIGTLLKLIQKDKANISLYSYQQDLTDLIEKLNLTVLLNMKKVN
jgi:hypothetical protein